VVPIKSFVLPGALCACLIVLAACGLENDYTSGPSHGSSSLTEVQFRRAAIGFWYLGSMASTTFGTTRHDTLAASADQAYEVAWFSDSVFRICSKNDRFVCSDVLPAPLTQASLEGMDFHFPDTTRLCKVTKRSDTFGGVIVDSLYYYRTPGDSALAAWPPLVSNPLLKTMLQGEWVLLRAEANLSGQPSDYAWDSAHSPVRISFHGDSAVIALDSPFVNRNLNSAYGINGGSLTFTAFSRMLLDSLTGISYKRLDGGAGIYRDSLLLSTYEMCTGIRGVQWNCNFSTFFFKPAR
jgi:hypothetical protein